MNKYLLIILMLASASSFAEINKWVDSDGRVHYSDQPPPADARKISPAKGVLPDAASDTGAADDNGNSAVSAAPPAQKTIAEREAERKKALKEKKDAADKAAQQKAADDAKNSSCAAAQQNLKSLQAGGRMVEIDANGERSYVSDDQRQQRIDKANQDISKFCN